MTNSFALFISNLTELIFAANVRSQIVEVEILHDTVQELREAFSVLLRHDRTGVSTIQVRGRCCHGNKVSTIQVRGRCCHSNIGGV